MRVKTARWYETTIKIEREGENGKIALAKETYAIESTSFADAESSIRMEEGDADVTAIKIAPYYDIILGEGDKYFKAKVAFFILDEKTGKEKRTNVYYLAKADNIEDARSNVAEQLKGLMEDYAISAITETKIINIIEK